jgi:hypothetical protein
VADELRNVVEVFSAPIEGLIVALGRDISAAQAELDRNSLKAQEQIDADTRLTGLGLQAPWHQLPRVDFRLKMAVTTVAPPPARATGAVTPGAPILGTAVRLVAPPISAAYQNPFDYDLRGSSELSLSIVPVPQPLAPAESTLPPRLSPEEARATAMRSRSAGFSTRRGEPVSGRRVETNFNPLTREWFVLQFDPKDPDKDPVVAAVDDATGSVRVIRS